jgi:hypothetical protein
MVDSVPTELLGLQTRLRTWRANRKYVRDRCLAFVVLMLKNVAEVFA